MGNKSSKSKQGKKEIKNNSKKTKNKKSDKEKEKTLFIHYSGHIQPLKYHGKFDLVTTKKELKLKYFIEEPIEHIFFQDNEEDILILNQNIPDNISVKMLVLKDLIPRNPTTALKFRKKEIKRNY